MKRHYYKLIAGLMVGISLFTLAGCSGKKAINPGGENLSTNENIPRGRYVEHMANLPEELDHIYLFDVDHSGRIHIYGKDTNGGLKGYTTEDGENWTTLDIRGLQEIESKGYYISVVDIGVDEVVYALCRTQDNKNVIAKVGVNQTVEYIDIEEKEGYFYPDKISVLENGDFLLGSYGNGVTRYSGQDGATLMEYYSQDGIFAVEGETLAIIDSQRRGVVVYNLITGEEINFVAYDYLDQRSQIAIDQEENIYIANKNGISRLVKGGSVWENMIEANMSSFGMPSLGVADVKIVEDTFHVLFWDSVEGNQLMSYTYDSEAPARPTTELSIYTLQENSTIRQAAAEYQRQNPDVIVQIQVGLTNNEGMTTADAIRTLNTELLAGKGPDILVLDGLPVQSYKEKGVLLNIEEDIKPLIEQEKVLDNIFKYYQQEDGIYGVPTRFTLPLLFGNEALLGEGTDFVSIADWAINNPTKQVFYKVKPEVLMTQFFGVSAPLWLGETGQIQEEAFKEFLQGIQLLSDIDAEVYDNPMILDMMSREYMAYKDTQLSLDMLESFFDIQEVYDAISHRGEGVFKGMTLNNEIAFQPIGVVGINANTQYEEIAREIVKLSLSEEVQRAITGAGLPVNNMAFDEKAIYDENIMFTTAIGMMRPNSRPIEMATLSQEVYNQVEEIAKGATIPMYQDEVLLRIIIEETKGYFDGTKTIDETVQAVAKRTKAYLAE